MNELCMISMKLAKLTVSIGLSEVSSVSEIHDNSDMCERNTCLCVLKASLLSLPSAFVSSRGQHGVVAAPASSQPAASVPRRQEPAAAVGRPHPERRARPAAAQGQRSAQPPLHLRPQV